MIIMLLLLFRWHSCTTL